jgi:catalase
MGRPASDVLAATPQAFYELLVASASKDPNEMKTFAAAHPEIAALSAWATSDSWTGSYAEERYNSLNSFIFTDSSGAEHTVRWLLLPAAQPVAVSPDDLAKRGPDFLEQEIAGSAAGRCAGRWW